MHLQSLLLQNFRNYSQKKFDFNPKTTVIVGENTAGKTNLAEAIMLLSTGKSFKADKDFEMISFGKDVGRVQGLIWDEPKEPDETKGEKTKIEIMVAQGEVAGGRFLKKFSVNGVAKSRSNFVGFLPAVLFRPEELDIIIDGPGVRRNFLNSVLESVDTEYLRAKTIYDKALRQRNALLDLARETGQRNTEQFAYWDDLLITNGNIITQKREAFLEYVNVSEKQIFDFSVSYDKSIISRERLDQYKDAEIGVGNTLVGPQRDDFVTYMDKERNIQNFGSRGQQRLAVLQLKLFHISYVEKLLKAKPLLVLDDIFSELDTSHIDLVLEKVQGNQIILTTTHKEFIDNKIQDFSVIELNK